MPDLTAIFGPNGRLSEVLPKYRVRSGQVEMAESVAGALKEEKHLICEAGTGTGKTLAYLIPALKSGKKVIVSTATRALQDQILSHDLPLLALALGRQPKVKVLKGLGNYLCRRRFRETIMQARGDVKNALPILADFAKHTETGDLAELTALREDDPILAMIASSSETRLGSKCEFNDTCFVSKARLEAEEAELIIVNHHLFFADLSMRGAHPGRVLPNYEVVVFDEAHQVEDVATQFFGNRFSLAQLQRILAELCRAAEQAGHSGGNWVDVVLAAAEGLRASANAFFAAIVSIAESGESGAETDAEGRVSIPPSMWKGEIRNALEALDGSLKNVEDVAKSLASNIRGSLDVLADMLEAFADRIGERRDALDEIVDKAEQRVCWLEASRSPILTSAPADISFLLKDRVFDKVDTAVLTSATLSQGRSGFGFIKQRLGLSRSDRLRELTVSSPFDYPDRALLYLPRHLPEPQDTQYFSAAIEEITTLIDMTSGGAFVLTTSLRTMRLYADILRKELPDYLVIDQSEGPKSAVVQRFRESGDAVLVATMGFWEGVDVPGDALRLVILDKIPFAVPSDPLVRARAARIEESGGRPFIEYFLPSAQIALKQGFGRLMRRESDYGIVALLDARVHTKSYGRQLVVDLPPAERVFERLDLRKRYGKIQK